MRLITLKYTGRKTREPQDVAYPLERFFRATDIHENVRPLGLALRGHHAGSNTFSPRTINSGVHSILTARMH